MRKNETAIFQRVISYLAVFGKRISQAFSRIVPTSWQLGRFFGVLIVAIAMSFFCSVASAVPVVLVSHQQVSPGGGLADMFWDGSDGRPASTAEWAWDGTTLSSTGTFSTISRIDSSPFGTTVIGDDVVDLVVNTKTMTVTATSYICVEGTLLASVGANGCATTSFGANSINETSVAYNVGGDASHVKRTLGGDDVPLSDGKPRGLSSVSADPGGAWDATRPAFDFFTVIASGLSLGDTVLVSDGPSGDEIVACKAARALGKLCDGGVGNGPDLRETAWLEFRVIIDTDGDGVPDDEDAFPNDPAEWEDTDEDGIGNNADSDDDNDGVLDAEDNFPLGQFNDVRLNYWAFVFIEALGRSGISAGCGAGNYCPLDPVTRAQVAVLIERGMRGGDFSPPAGTGNVFLDVGSGDFTFAADFIEQLFMDGIAVGCGSNNYCPNAELTRAEMAVLLLRAKHGGAYAPPPATGIFFDVPGDYWAAAWIDQLAAEGITIGCGNGNYCPDAVVTREQVAKFVVLTFGL